MNIRIKVRPQIFEKTDNKRGGSIRAVWEHQSFLDNQVDHLTIDKTKCMPKSFCCKYFLHHKTEISLG